jgi:2-polyprenyl-3-methyl-5-hydroxy-6-metoxy-1,4-benzoquinol methylase
MKISQCLICQSPEIIDAYAKDGYSFFECSKCHVIFMNPQPSLAELSEDIYREKTGYHAKLERNLANLKKYKKRFTVALDEFKNMGVKGPMLDVACANGEFMFMAKQQGFDVQGVELNRDSAKVARDNGFTVFDGTLEQARFADNYFSLIHLGGVVEVVPDPVALLKECKRILKPGGVMAISNMNADSFWGKVTKKAYAWFALPWSLLVPKYRLFLFRDAEFEKLLLQLGFTVLKTHYYNGFLRHELGGTGVMQKFKKSKTLYNFLRVLIVFFVYAALHYITLAASLFSVKKFGTIVFVKKT